MSRILIAALLLLAWASSGQGARDIDFNVDFFCGWDGYYRPMEWTPVEVGIGADLKEPFSGSFTMTARQDGLNTLNVIHSFVLTPDRPLSVPLVTKFAFATDRCTLSIRDEKGRGRWRQVINLWDFSLQNRMLRVVQEQDLLIGLIGQAQYGLLRLPEETVSMAGPGAGKVYLGSKVPRVAPWDWTGYVSLDLLVLCDVDWTLLRPQQIKAIQEWISNGGTALLILGQHPLPAESPLSEFIPFRVGEPRQVQIPLQALEEWGLDSSGTPTVTAWSLFPKPKAVIDKKIETPDGGCLYGAGYAGFGRMAVLAFNPSQLGEEQTGRSAAFWTRQIAACCRSETPSTSDLQPAGGRRILVAEPASQAAGNPRSGFNPNDNRYRISVAQNASNQVMEFLYQLEQMRPLSIWWIVLTLMALAVLLGPVDYLVLKRLDKLPYTWLTSAGWIVVFTVGAYFGVQWLRGGAMEVRAVSVLDGIADSNCAWATSYTGLFAPRSGDYRLGGLAPNQWWSGISPMRQELWSYQRDSGMQQIHCVQADGGNLPVSLPVNMWTVQPLLSEWALDRMPFAASVEHQGPEATVEIRNTSDSAIQRGYVLFEDTCADVGPVPAHSIKRFDVRTRPFRSWQQSPPRPAPVARGQPPGMVPGVDIPRYPGPLGSPVENAVLAQGCLNRTLAMHTYLDFGAALVCVVFENAPLPIEVKDRSYAVNHVQLARQLVLPKNVEDRGQKTENKR
jgi:hypothetical protein